jgi:hypothetical protein
MIQSVGQKSRMLALTVFCGLAGCTPVTASDNDGGPGAINNSMTTPDASSDDGGKSGFDMTDGDAATTSFDTADGDAAMANATTGSETDTDMADGDAAMSNATADGDAAMSNATADGDAAMSNATLADASDAMLESAVTPEAGSGDDSASQTDGVGGSCIEQIFGTYTIRANGHAVHEGVSSETVVVDYASGTNATPLQNVIAVQPQFYAACALVQGGTVSCWQEDAANGNVYGQLGNGTMTPVAVYRAVQVLHAANAPLTNVVALAAGLATNTACAVTGDHKLWCWGNLTWIVNGGTQDYSPYAQAVTQDGQSALTGVIQAGLGVAQACAVIQGSPNNTVSCWGWSPGEELGQGNGVSHQYPIQVPGLTNPTKVVLSNVYYNVGGPRDAVCVLDGQAVECWGGGSPNVGPVPAPTLVTTTTSATLRQVQDVQEGLGRFAFLRSDATAWIWSAPHGQATAYGVPNIVQVGWAGGDSSGLRYITSDGQYHINMATAKVDCSL